MRRMKSTFLNLAGDAATSFIVKFIVLLGIISRRDNRSIFLRLILDRAISLRDDFID